MSSTMAYAHGTVMTLAWMVFGSTGVLFARYGRVIRLGNRRQLLGKSVWFQTHRFLLSMSSLLTLMGFFFISVQLRGQSVISSVNSTQFFAHSVVGGVVVCCVIIQIWLALYRCHPNSRFRFIFDWSHRIIGSCTAILSFSNIFIITFSLPKLRIGLVITFSLWSSWIVIVVILFEIIQYQYRKALALMAANARANNANQEAVNRNALADTEAGTNLNVDNQRLNKMKLFLLLIHIVISVVFCIPLIVLIWNQS